MNLLLVTVLTATFAALEITVITFPMEARTIKREWRNGWYRVTSYFLGRTLADLPFSLSFLFAFSALVYVMTGQIGGLASWRFGYFLCAVIMTALIAQSFGFIFGAAFMDNLPAAVFMAPLAIFPSLLYSGFFSRVSQIPAFYRPFTHLSHFRYTFDALLITLYGANRCQCDQEALDKYQRSLTSERDSLRDMFSIFFGSNECASPEDTTTTTTSGFPVTTSAPELASAFNSSELIAHEDLAAVSASNSTLGALLSSTIAQSTSSAATLSPRLSASTNPMRQLNQLPLVKTVENAIVDSLFEQLANSTSTNSSALSATDPAGLNETMTTLAGQPLEAEPTHRLGAMDRISLRFGQSITRMLSKQANFGRPMPTSCASYNSYLLQEFELNDESLVTALCMLLLFVLGTRLLCGLILNYTIATRAR